MTLVERLDHFWESVNDVGSDFGTHLGPWLIDVPFAWAAGWNAVRVFGWPVPVAACVGAGTELIGLAAVRQMLRMKDYNVTKASEDPRAPQGLAMLAVGLYFGGTAALMMLDALSSWAIPARLVIPLMGIVGTLVHGMTLDHKRRVEANEARRAEVAHQEELAQRRAERAQRRQEVAATVTQPAATVDRRAAMLDILRNNGHATPSDIAQQVGISRQAVAKRLQTLQRQGAIVDGNGDGWRVLA